MQHAVPFWTDSPNSETAPQMPVWDGCRDCGLPELPSMRDRWFESVSLQRRVWYEPAIHALEGGATDVAPQDQHSSSRTTSPAVIAVAPLAWPSLTPARSRRSSSRRVRIAGKSIGSLGTSARAEMVDEIVQKIGAKSANYAVQRSHEMKSRGRAAIRLVDSYETPLIIMSIDGFDALERKGSRDCNPVHPANSMQRSCAHDKASVDLVGLCAKLCGIAQYGHRGPAPCRGALQTVPKQRRGVLPARTPAQNYSNASP
jgi:hypothetical protein